MRVPVETRVWICKGAVTITLLMMAVARVTCKVGSGEIVIMVGLVLLFTLQVLVSNSAFLCLFFFSYFFYDGVFIVIFMMASKSGEEGTVNLFLALKS